jgi:sulfite exporter TauE/SafE
MSEYLSSFPIIFGFLAAAIHVLAGPDHLAAIAPLALNTKFKPWMIGMSWGIGHLLGMLGIGVLFFFFKELIPVEFISANSERIVGILLIAIGLWAIARLYYNTKSQHKHAHTHRDETGNAFVHVHGHKHETKLKHTHNHFEKQTYLAAFGIGVLHGLAGVSHVISMLPTLAFETRLDSILYLFGFGAGTISAMALFSIILGLISQYSTEQKKQVVFKTVNVLAGIGAIFVGFIWLWNTW